MENPCITYAKPNADGYITAVNSSAFLPDTEGWTEIDRGYGDKYHHAQGNYFPQPIYTESGMYRYKLADGKAVECTAEEIARLEAALPLPQPSVTLETRVGGAGEGCCDCDSGAGKTLQAGGRQPMSIRQIQLLLLYLGYSPGEPDGLDGPATQAAVKQFQADFGGIATDGIPGAETQKALKCAVVYGSLRRDTGKTGEKSDSFWAEIRYFSPEEPYIRCPCGQCDRALPTEKLMRLADKLRILADAPIIPTSTVRCAAHNAAVGGVANSRHLQGCAMDFYIPGWDAQRTLALAKTQPETAYAYAINETAVHMDVTP